MLRTWLITTPQHSMSMLIRTPTPSTSVCKVNPYTQTITAAWQLACVHTQTSCSPHCQWVILTDGVLRIFKILIQQLTHMNISFQVLGITICRSFQGKKNRHQDSPAIDALSVALDTYYLYTHSLGGVLSMWHDVVDTGMLCDSVGMGIHYPISTKSQHATWASYKHIVSSSCINVKECKPALIRLLPPIRPMT